MKLLLVQETPAFADPAANLERIDDILAAAARFDVVIAVFPEMFLTGYNIGEKARDLAEPADGAHERALRRSAARTGVALVVGLPQRQGDRVRNTALAIDRDGGIAGRYAKVQLFGEGEKAMFEAGTEHLTAELAGCRVGLAICYDIEFPECARRLAKHKVDAILVPTANMVPYWDVPTTLVRARALENGVTIAYANLAGQEGDLTYTGMSAVVGPDGRDLARAGTDPALLIVDIGPALGRAAESPMSTQARDVSAVWGR